MLWKAEACAVEEKNVFYNYFMFENLVYKNNVLNSWDMQPCDPKCLKHLSFSR